MIQITLLTQPDCALCEQAKRVLIAVGKDVELFINDVALDSDEGRNIADEGGFAFAPGVLLDGEPFSYGRLSERKLRRALAARVARR